MTPKKRKKPVSTTAKALAECRKRGWVAQTVEQTIPKMFIKRDLFGCIDIIAITDSGIMGIQATGGVGSHAHRRAKILEEERLGRWVKAGGQFELWSWTKQGPRGKQKRWTLRVQTYQEMVMEHEKQPPEHKAFAKAVAEYLKRGSEAEVDMAAHFEVAPSTVQRWSRGTARPHPLLQAQVHSFIDDYSEMLLVREANRIMQSAAVQQRQVEGKVP